MLVHPVIVGFGHRARSGKDTVVQAILDAYKDKYDIRRYGFADALKEEVAGHEYELCLRFGIEPEPNNKWRKLLQFYGTEYRRKQDNFYWIKQLAAKLLKDRPQVALISDLRFPNEFLWVKANKGLTINVVRTGFVDLMTNGAHASESSLDGFPYDIKIEAGDGEVDHLRQCAVQAFEMVIKYYTVEPPDLSVPAMEAEAAEAESEVEQVRVQE